MHDEKEMTFLEHLEEMRGVILRCVAAFTVAFICVLIGFHYFNNLMMYPLNSAKRIIAMWVEPSPDDIKAEDQKLGPVYLVGTQKGADGEAVKQGPFFIVPTQNGIVLKPQSDSGSDWYNAIKLRSMSFTTPLVIWFYVGFLGAIGFSMPIMLYFVARFIAPGLKPEELKMLRPGMIAGIILFAIGICFGFMFILPMGIAFMSFMSQSMSLEMFPDAQSYYSMVIFVTLAIGLTFQLPLLEVILIYLGVLNVEWLKKNRKIAFFCILLFATVVTPPDVFTQVSITVPLYIMYEGALVIGARLRKKKLEKERQEEILQAEEDERERREYAQMVARERLEEKREAESYESGDYGDISGVEDMENMNHVATIISPEFSTALKIPLVLVDLAAGALVYLIVRDLTSDDRKASIGFALWFLCPIVIYMSSIQGTFDNISGLLTLLSVFLVLRRHYYAGGFILMTAILLKLYPGFALTVIIALIYAREGMGRTFLRDLMLLFAGGISAFAVLMAPTFLDGTFTYAFTFITDRSGSFSGSSLRTYCLYCTGCKRMGRKRRKGYTGTS